MIVASIGRTWSSSPPGASCRTKAGRELFTEAVYVDRFCPDGLSEVEACELPQVREEGLKSAGLGRDRLGGLLALRGRLEAAICECEGEPGDRVERMRDLVGDVGEESALVEVGVLEPLGHAVERPPEVDEFVWTGAAHARGELAARESVGGLDCPLDGSADGAADYGRGEARDEDHEADYTSEDERQL